MKTNRMNQRIRLSLLVVVVSSLLLLINGCETEPRDDLLIERSFIHPQEIVINELMFDPLVGGAEYVELYNRSTRPCSLSNLAFALRKSDGTLGSLFSLSGVDHPIAPKGYLVCTKKRERLLLDYQISDPAVVIELKMPTLKNEGAAVVLLQRVDHVVVDEVSYSPRWHDPAIKKQKGVALERINPDGFSQDEANWSSALRYVGYGTPGLENSLYTPHERVQRVQIALPEYVAERSTYCLRYQTDRMGYRCRLTLFTPRGIRVASLANNQRLALSGELEWNGLSLSGHPLPVGVYLFYAEIYHNEGVVKREKRLFFMKPL